MKIQPIPQSQGTAGVSTTSTGAEQTSKERKQASIAAFKGEAPVTVTESDSYMDPFEAKKQQTTRSIKMTTNATPGPREAVVQTEVIPESEPKTASPDVIAETKGSIEETKPLDPQLAELAKARRTLQVKEREIADREAKIQSQPDVMAKLKADPLRVLREAGVTYDQLTESLLANQSSNTPEIQELKAEIKAIKEGFDSRDSQQEQQVLAEIDRNVSKLVAEGDRFEMIRVTGSQKDVRELIHRTFKQTGEILSEEEASQLVEDDLVNETLKIANTKKVRSRLTPEQQQQSQAQSEQPTMKTLTSRGNAAPQMSRKERALAAFYGTLKK